MGDLFMFLMGFVVGMCVFHEPTREGFKELFYGVWNKFKKK